jgi:hypothetical protein
MAWLLCCALGARIVGLPVLQNRRFIAAPVVDILVRCLFTF